MAIDQAYREALKRITKLEAQRDQAIAERDAARKDTERLDHIQANEDGSALLSDDFGRWAVSGNGFQNVPESDGPSDIQTTFFVKANNWKPTVREAIDDARAIYEVGTAVQQAPHEGS